LDKVEGELLREKERRDEKIRKRRMA